MGLAHALVVDPDAGCRLRISQIVQKQLGHAISAAEGHAAAEILRNQPIAVMFTELRLPDRCGLTLFAEARRLQPQLQAVIVTAPGALEDSIEAFRNGVADFVLKPALRPSILAALDRALHLAAGSSSRPRPPATVDEPPTDAAETIEVPLQGSLRQMEQRLVEDMVRRFDGNKAAAARALGIHRKSLYRLLENR